MLRIAVLAVLLLISHVSGQTKMNEDGCPEAVSLHSECPRKEIEMWLFTMLVNFNFNFLLINLFFQNQQRWCYITDFQ